MEMVVAKMYHIDSSISISVNSEAFLSSRQLPSETADFYVYMVRRISVIYNK